MPFCHRRIRTAAGSPAGPLLLLTIFILGQVCAPAGATPPPHPGSLPHLQTAAPSGRIVLKLSPASGLAMDPDGVRVRPGAPAAAAKSARGLQELVAGLLPAAGLRQHIPTAPVKSMAAGRGDAGPDLSLYAHLDTRGLSRDELIKLSTRLAADPRVESAFLEPVAVPAARGFDAFTGQFTPPERPLSQAAAPDRFSGLFEGLQGYLGDAPVGVSALSMRDVPGQRGFGVTVMDIEGAWVWDHEDLPDPLFELGTQVITQAWRDHGTAVMGEIRGGENLYGVTGIVPECRVAASSIDGIGTAAALAAALDHLEAGDVVLIELHAPGPLSGGGGDPQYGYLPMEYWLDVFDTIRLATSRGIIVCEAAGNGFQNLDNPLYLGFFDRQVRDSGAIMIGATEGSDLHSADFSNHGTRVDLNGWGANVVTTGFGDLAGLVETEFYTQQFSGTSSASPMVTASVASMQAMVRQDLGFDLDARLARDLLRETGTPMVFGNLIGTRPDLAAAFDLAAARVGELAGTVTELGSGTPLEGVLVEVQGGGSFTLTDEQGHWRLPLQRGPVLLRFTSYYHQALETSATVLAGASLTHDQALAALPLVDILGTISDPDMAPLADVVLTPLDAPLPGTVTSADGKYSIPDVPSGHVYQLLCDGLPGYGAQVMTVNASRPYSDAIVNMQLSPVTQDFESGDGGFTCADTTAWSYGAPPEVTGGAFDGSLCWGLGMDGDYTSNWNPSLVSPLYDLSSVEAEDYYLSFHFFCDTENGFDGVCLEYQDGYVWEVLEPLGGYSDLALGGLGNLPGWSGQTGRWQGAVFDLTPFLGGDFRFRLTFGSDGSVTGPGFFVDGLSFGGGGRVSGVTPPVAPASGVRLQAWPNPFNPRVSISYELPRAGQVQIMVFDIKGRRVKTLLSGAVDDPRGTLIWEGDDQAGRPAASGVYFVMVAPSQGAPAVQRVVLAK